MSDDGLNAELCRVCGDEPHDWEELDDGRCPECTFEDVIASA